MKEEARKYYQMLKDNGDLEEVFPYATGEWENDSDAFTIYYEDSMQIVDDFEHGAD